MERRRHFPAQGVAVAEQRLDFQVAEPQKLKGADVQTPQIGRKGVLNEYLDAFRGNLAKPGWIAGPEVRADRDLGGGTGSMVQADQIKDR